jgi:hypothetical protein
LQRQRKQEKVRLPDTISAAQNTSRGEIEHEIMTDQVDEPYATHIGGQGDMFQAGLHSDRASVSRAQIVDFRAAGALFQYTEVSKICKRALNPQNRVSAPSHSLTPVLWHGPS